MTKISVLCWQEIPSVVEAKDGKDIHKVGLSQRFQELIDLIAVKRGLDGTDDYLMHWRKDRRPDSDAGPVEAAETLAAEIEAAYATIRADAIAGS